MTGRTEPSLAAPYPHPLPTGGRGGALPHPAAPVAAEAMPRSEEDSGGALTRATVETRLRQVGTEHYHDRHPFHHRLHGGQSTQGEVQAWVVNRWYSQSRIPMTDAAFLSRCTDPDLRRIWRSRIDDHDGGRSGVSGVPRA